MIHQPVSSFFQSPTGNFSMETEEVIYLREAVVSNYARRTGQPRAVIWYDLDRDVFMSATEAKAYGIVDLIAA